MSLESVTLPLPWPTQPIASVAAGGTWQALSSLDFMFLAAVATLILALVLGRWRLFTPLFAFGYGVQFWALAQADVLTGQPLVASFALRVLRQPLLWRYDSLSWFFAILTIGAAFVCSLFALAPSTWRSDAAGGGALDGATPGIWHLFHVALALSVLSSLCLFGSGNLLALYVSWEVVVWSFFLLLTVGGGLALSAAIRYAAYSFAGGMALLGALALIFRAAGSVDFARVTASLPTLGLGSDLLLGVLLLGALGLRLGALPLFAWQPGVARPPVPVFWHGIAARVGFFALLLLLARIIGVEWLAQLGGSEWIYGLNLRILLCWVAVLLLLFGGWRARQQGSAGGVLSWLALSQTGLVLLAVLLGGPFGTASGLLQLFSLGLAEAVLAGLCLVAVPLLTADGLAVGGLQWLARGAALLAGASLVGLPPTLGFVSKWLLYDALLTDAGLGWSRWVLLTLAVLGTLLSLMGLIRLVAILRACGGRLACAARPYGVMAPVLGLSGLTLLAGVVPGPAMSWVEAMQQALGVPVLDWTLGGVEGRFNMFWLTLWQVLLLLPLLALSWWLGRRTSEPVARARAMLWRWVERLQGAPLQPDCGAGSAVPLPGQRRRLEPLLARAMNGVAAGLAGLVATRLAPWTLSVTLILLVVWALGAG
ncbi:proton-conducting transporter membrane subunit [Rhabdochromatium marinum]|uniref:proton-conducting transporter transmembrane domain-containing protein n=1 Tax=Rhabdochromatium marinum TaxID=48729 RepID=UPI0019056C17|nr:proton-conducting transporter membrane subunit [Rhabdochromatium marinum]